MVGLLTTVGKRGVLALAMHGVRRALLEAQAAALGLPLHVVELPWPCSNDVYEQRMAVAIGAAVEAGVDAMVFGDLFLQDVRSYREQALEGTGIRPLFPLWERPTPVVASELLKLGVRAVVSCVDASQAPIELAGRWYDEAFLAELPAGVDPCRRAANSTVVVDSPDFSSPLPVAISETVERDGACSADVIPPQAPAA